MARRKTLFLPEVLDPEPKPWENTEVEIRDSAVDLTHRQAWIPRPLTDHQKLARKHELGHVKYTPRNWMRVAKEVVVLASEDEPISLDAALRISKMLEENRIDWLLWDKHQIDIRPTREVLDWSGMPVPSDPLSAMNWVLQLAWTVWASRGLSASIPNRPPERECDVATGEFFDSCWAVLANHHPSMTSAIVRGCLAIYEEPTNERRNRVAAELATFFPPVKEDEPPPVKEDEKKEEAAAEAEEKRQEQKVEEEESGIGGSSTSHGYWDIHDHTTTVRRSTVRIKRRETPVAFGIKLTFAHRYLLDKAVFAHRTVTEGGILIDGSGSMSWNSRDLQGVVAKLPAVTVGIYHGFRHSGHTDGGRLCILAKGGRFCQFTGRDPGYTAENAIDVEALRILGTWPRPRFWLSDGYTCDGKYRGPWPIKEECTTWFMRADGNVMFEANRVMRAFDILRVPDVPTLEKLLARQRVTLYRTCIPGMGVPYREKYVGSKVLPSPVTFQL